MFKINHLDLDTKKQNKKQTKPWKVFFLKSRCIAFTEENKKKNPFWELNLNIWEHCWCRNENVFGIMIKTIFETTHSYEDKWKIWEHLLKRSARKIDLQFVWTIFSHGKSKKEASSDWPYPKSFHLLGQIFFISFRFHSLADDIT